MEPTWTPIATWTPEVSATLTLQPPTLEATWTPLAQAVAVQATQRGADTSGVLLLVGFLLATLVFVLILRRLRAS